MRERASIACAACVAIATCALHVLAEDDVGTFDPDMEIPGVVTNGVKWIDGRLLPLEGRAFDGTEHYYDRLPTNVTEGRSLLRPPARESPTGQGRARG